MNKGWQNFQGIPKLRHTDLQMIMISDKKQVSLSLDFKTRPYS